MLRTHRRCGEIALMWLLNNLDPWMDYFCLSMNLKQNHAYRLTDVFFCAYGILTMCIFLNLHYILENSFCRCHLLRLEFEITRVSMMRIIFICLAI